MRITNGGSVGIGTNTMGTNATLAVNGGEVIGTYANTATAGVSNGLIVSGNVGIGTSSPTRALDVAASVTHSINGTASQIALRIPTSPTNKLNLGYDTTSNYGFIEAMNESTSWQNLALQPTGGSVGIGTTNPTTMLQVGSTPTAGNACNISNTGVMTNCTWNGVVIGAAYGGASGFTQGSVPFANSSGLLTQNNSQFFWDNTNDRLGIGKAVPLSPLSVVGGLAVGAYGGGASTTAAPSNGLIVSGNAGFGTTTIDAPLAVSGAIENVASANYYRSVLSYYIGASTQTGTLDIKLPTAVYNNDALLSVEIRGYDFASTYGAWDVLVSFQPGGGAGTTAVIRGRAPFTSVRVGYDGTHNVILLGTTSTVWTYDTVEVSDVMPTWVTTGGWGTGWAGALLTRESGITVTGTATIDMYTNGSGLIGIGTTSTSDANGNTALQVKGASSTDIISVTDGTRTFAVYMSTSASVPQVQLGSVSNHGLGVFTTTVRLSVE